MLPGRLQQLVQQLCRLPSVGEKTAQRFALFLIAHEPDTARALGRALLEVTESIGTCERCGHLAERHEDAPLICSLCRDTRRDAASLCVVARIQDLLSIERSHAFKGYYFVLGRLLSPLEGVGADELPLQKLRARVAEGVTEVVVATPPSVDGEATALLLAQFLRDANVQVTRIASGVPHGGDLEFADPVTLGRALAGRRGLD